MDMGYLVADSQESDEQHADERCLGLDVDFKVEDRWDWQ